MTILLKLGGSLITDKRKARAFRKSAAQHIVRQIKQVWTNNKELGLIIGHGSGSFGHVEASKHNTIAGVHTPQEWLGFARVAESASALSQLLLQEFLHAGLPVIRFQPSSMTMASDGQVLHLATELLSESLNLGLIPLVHGDVAIDVERGGTIVSTEKIFARLANDLPIRRIVLLGEVDGVLDSNGDLVSTITPSNFELIASALHGASGVDVTGGMLRKVEDMLNLVVVHPELRVNIANGFQPNVLADLLIHNRDIGTVIRSD